MDKTEAPLEDYDSAAEIIRTEVVGDLADIRMEFLAHFENETEQFVRHMTHALLRWSEWPQTAGQNERKGSVSALVYSAISQHIISLRLFLSGYLAASGNSQRQVIETIALSLLCSCSKLDILDRFAQDKYSTNNAVRDAVRQSDKLNVNRGALTDLQVAEDFYHMYSHLTIATLASHMRFSDEGPATYVGASFDEGKLEQYRKEVALRISLSKVFENFVCGVIQNVAEWGQD